MLPEQSHEIAAAAANVEHCRPLADIQRRRDAESVLVRVGVSVCQSAVVLFEFGFVPAQPGGIPFHSIAARQAAAAVGEEGGALVGAQRRARNELHAVVGRPIEGIVVRLPVVPIVPNQKKGERCK